MQNIIRNGILYTSDRILSGDRMNNGSRSYKSVTRNNKIGKVIKKRIILRWKIRIIM